MDKLVNVVKNNRKRSQGENYAYTLTSQFDYVVVSIEEFKDLSLMTLNDLQASLESCEMQMNERLSGTIEQALKAQANVRNEDPIQRRVDHSQMDQNFKRRRNLQFDSSQGTNIEEGKIAIILK
ncbi:hypothetical protein CR513_33014, partial [Mucuna pruriens]